MSGPIKGTANLLFALIYGHHYKQMGMKERLDHMILRFTWYSMILTEKPRLPELLAFDQMVLGGWGGGERQENVFLAL